MYCNANDFGSGIRYRQIATAANVVETFTSPYSFFVPKHENNEWMLSPVYTLRIGAKYVLRTVFGVSGSVDIMQYSGASLMRTDSVIVGAPTDAIYVPKEVYESSYDIVLSADRGYAVQTPLVVGTQLYIGDSVITADNRTPMVVTEARVSRKGEILLVGPEDLRSAAITIANRVAFLERDQEAEFDDGTFDRLTDGLSDILARYVPNAYR